MSRFQANEDRLKKVFLLPHEEAFESYLKALLLYKVLNLILFINKKLYKAVSESFYHMFFECRHTKQFWKEFQYYYYTLTRDFVFLTLRGFITGILYTNCPLLNYLILIANLYLWGFRRNRTLPVITAFSFKVKIKNEIEKYKCVKTNKMEKFNKKWAPPLDSVP